MRTFQDALEKLGKRESRKIDNNTYLQKREDGSIAVKLHNTDVVTFQPDGAVVLNSGGWQTVTTKDRINNYSPFRVFSDRGVWYVNATGSWDKDSSAVFADGITYKDGKFTGQGKDPSALRKRAQKFAAEYMRKLAAGEIPAPGAGDCFGCQFRTDDGRAGIAGDHMESHLDENYFVPSMIVNAFKAFGAAKVQWWGLAEIWPSLLPKEQAQETVGKINGGKGFKEWATDARSKRMLTRLVYRELGLAA